MQQLQLQLRLQLQLQLIINSTKLCTYKTKTTITTTICCILESFYGGPAVSLPHSACKFITSLSFGSRLCMGVSCLWKTRPDVAKIERFEFSFFFYSPILPQCEAQYVNLAAADNYSNNTQNLGAQFSWAVVVRCIEILMLMAKKEKHLLIVFELKLSRGFSNALTF